MKSFFFIVLISFTSLVFCQKNEEKIKPVFNYADSLDNIIMDFDSIPGNIMSNTVSIMRNERAIGMQYTKITFFYMQKEDSLVDSGNEVLFYPVYNPPVKITIEYNIAASQNVNISYYFYDKYIYYSFKSTGDYGYDENKYVLTKSGLKYLAKYDGEGKSPVTEKYSDFSTEENTQWGKIYSNWLDYEKLYFQVFNSGQLYK